MELQKLVNSRGEVIYVDPDTNKVMRREDKPNQWAKDWDASRGVTWRDYQG